jgi:hypothetical protein
MTGKVLTHATLMLAGSGDALADIEHLRSQPDLSARCRRRPIDDDRGPATVSGGAMSVGDIDHG